MRFHLGMEQASIGPTRQNKACDRPELGGAGKLRQLDVLVRTLLAFEGRAGEEPFPFRAEGAVKLLRQMGAEVHAACLIVDLPDLGGVVKPRKLDVPVRTLVAFEEH
jgi:hypothetical protein